MGARQAAQLVIRADGDAGIGTGHVMRCIALAEAWIDRGGAAVLAAASIADSLRLRCSQHRLEVAPLDAEPGSDSDADLAAGLARDRGARWLVLDGYRFGPEYQRRARQAGVRILAIDDMAHFPYYHADALLNHNVGAERYRYLHGLHTRLMLGPSYALVRREFTQETGRRRTIRAQATRVLLTLGGSDCTEIAGRILEGLRPLCRDGFEVVVAGGGQAAASGLAVLAGGTGIKFHDPATGLAALMAWADIAISAAGVTSLELAFMGLPALLVVLADNQRQIADSFAEQECAVNLGCSSGITAERITAAVQNLANDPERRAAMSERLARLVDGAGAARAVDLLLSE